jgi:hypothetical protein
VLVAAWFYRDSILRTASRWLGPRTTALPPVSDTAVGAPTPRAVANARGKLASLRQPGGPDSVVLTPSEVASLIGGGMDWTIRKTFDSLRVELLDGQVAVHARLDTRRMPRETLGPLAGIVRPEEPIRIAGPLAIARRGTARWTVRELSIRGFPFPGAALRRLARDVAGADASGAVEVVVDSGVADVVVSPLGLVCYRRRRA